MFKLVENYHWAGTDYEVFRCEYDGFTITVPYGADIAECPSCCAREAEQESQEEQ